VKHSKEPWKQNFNCVSDATDTLVATFEFGGPRKGERPTYENTARAVACVNACAGIADPAAVLAEVRRNLREFDEKFGDWGVGYDARRLLALLGAS
jgi:hypothetical protein